MDTGIYNDRPLSLPRLVILNSDPEIQELLRTETIAETWLDDRGELCMWSTLRQGRPSLVAPGLASYELCEDAVVAQPFRPGVERLVEDTYWRSVLPLFVQHRGAQALHASAVVGPAGVVGICGRAGAGKSTLACGLSQRGHRLWADDALVVTAGDPPRTTALRGEIRLLPDVRHYLGLTSVKIDVTAELGEVAEIAALVVLDAGSGGGRLTPASRPLGPGDAFAALMEHSYVYEFESGKRSLTDFFLELVAAIPVHEIVRPAGLDRLSETLDLAEELIACGTG